MDYALILEGPQNLGKSMALCILGGDWFSDDMPDLHSKDAAINLRGKWIIELGELAAIARSSLEEVKRFITRQVDHYRAPYGRSA